MTGKKEHMNKLEMNSFLAQEFGKSQNYTGIENSLYRQNDVKKGLRNEDGTGVIVGLTRISDVVGYEMDAAGRKKDIPGKLYYRGIDLKELTDAHCDDAGGYEEVMFLLLFGFLPDKQELDEFRSLFRQMYPLPGDFLEMNILRVPTQNIMNKLQHAILTLYSYDQDPDNSDTYPTLLKGLRIVAQLPSIMCYAYQSMLHYFKRSSLIIHYPREDFSIPENILCMLREDRKFSEREAILLDKLFMVLADHGGGNNSTFTDVVVSSAGTDIYSAVAAATGALKGPRQGGANVLVTELMHSVISEIGISAGTEEMKQIVNRILDRDFFDKSGTLYGFGHVIYTVSDPRAEIIRDCSVALAEEKGKMQELDFYIRFEQAAKEVMKERYGTVPPTHVDFYTSFVYDMLLIPTDLFSAVYVCARTVGWIAHNLENKMYDGRIMRPATKYIGEITHYVPILDR